MDLSTVETNLKNGEYQTASQFHGDINKIWLNSYAYNEKTSPLYKLTSEVEKYYKNMLANEGMPKKDKVLAAKPRAGSISK
jgi:bromodomain-containing factor 1